MISRFCAQFNLGIAHLDDGKFRSDKKTVEENQEKGEQYIKGHK
jgi:hypothetical protein